MNLQDNKHTFRYKFRQQISIFKSCRAIIQKGIIDDQFNIVKIIKCKDQSQILLYKQILYERTQIQRYLYSQSMFSSRLVTETVKEINKTSGQEQKYLYIFYPFFPTNSLCSYVSNSSLSTQNRISKLQKSQKIIKIICQSCVKLMRSTNKQMYSFQNFMFDQNAQQIRINPISFVGMELMMFNQQISQPNFIQIYELLGSYTLQKQPKNRLSIQLKFRAIGILFLSMLIQRQFKLPIDKKKLQSTSQQTPLQNYIGLTSQIPQKFKTLLQIKMIKDKIAAIDTKYRVNYFKFLQIVFVEEKELTWTNVLDLIIPKQYSNPINHDIPLKANYLAELFYKFNVPKEPNQDILEKLGLKKENEMQLYFLTLISQEGVNTEELLKYKNIDEYIYQSHQINMQNMSIYKNIIKLVQILLQKQSVKESENYFNKVFGITKQKTEQKQTQFLTSKQIESLQAFIYQISLKFGVYETKNQNKRQITWKNETRGLHAYSKLFK